MCCRWTRCGWSTRMRIVWSWSPAISRRMFAREGHPGKIVTTSDLVAGVADADVVLIQLRIGGQAARKTDETWPHACGCIGQETTGPGGFAKALRTVPVVLRGRRGHPHAREAGCLDHRLHQPGRHRHPRAAAGRPPRGRAVQRGHRLPAQVRHHARRRATSTCSCSTSGSTTSPGNAASPWTAGRCCPSCSSAHLGELAEEVELPASLLALLGMVPSYYLRYFYAHDHVLTEQLGSRTRARGGHGGRAHPAGPVRRPDAWTPSRRR